MRSKRGVAGLAVAALTIADLSACGDDADRATATGTRATTATEPSEVPDGVAALHYAENSRIPSDGEYTLRATVKTPQFRRHGDESEGPELMDGAEVEFENVMIDVDA